MVAVPLKLDSDLVEDVYFERNGEVMPLDTDLEPGDIVVIPASVHGNASDWGNYVAGMSLHIAAAARGCEVKRLDPGPNGEFRRLVQLPPPEEKE